MHDPAHIPVLPEQVLWALDPQPGQRYLDCTAGLGGHAGMVAGRLGGNGLVVLCDLDEGNLQRASAHVRAGPGAPRVVTLAGNFAEVPRRLVEQSLQVDLVLADLGFASSQVDDPARGLSFSRPGPLDMRLNPRAGPTAADLVASMSEADLARVLHEYGEERHARLVARRIVEARRTAPITTTEALASIVRSAVGGRSGGIDPATRTFQALRVAVNDELGNLHALLESIRRQAFGLDDTRWLAPGARVVFISFHSLEDRPVKQVFAEIAGAGAGELLLKKPAVADEREERTNPRSRSAKLRALVLKG